MKLIKFAFSTMPMSLIRQYFEKIEWGIIYPTKKSKEQIVNALCVVAEYAKRRK
jgi:hypothetical protein